MLESVLIILVAYLWGGVPSGYIVGRYLKGIDLRAYGSGSLGASNLMEHVGRLTGFGVGVFDCVGKGTLTVVVTDLMGQTLAVQALAGLAAIAGHSWSPYLRFTGGRGVATAIGVLLGFFMWKEMLAGVFLIGLIGRAVMRDTAFWTLATLIVLPLLTYAFGEPMELVYMSSGISALLVLKRLTANWERPGQEYGLPRTLAYRVLWDRDVPRKLEWTTRRPPPAGEG